MGKKGLDFHDCDVNRRVPQSSTTQEREYWVHTTWVDYYCSQCGTFRHSGPMTTVKVSK